MNSVIVPMLSEEIIYSYFKFKFYVYHWLCFFIPLWLFPASGVIFLLGGRGPLPGLCLFKGAPRRSHCGLSHFLFLLSDFIPTTQWPAFSSKGLRTSTSSIFTSRGFPAFKTVFNPPKWGDRRVQLPELAANMPLPWGQATSHTVLILIFCL